MHEGNSKANAITSSEAVERRYVRAKGTQKDVGPNGITNYGVWEGTVDASWFQR